MALFYHLTLGTVQDRPRTTSIRVITTEGMKTADLKAEPNISHFPETASGQMEQKKIKINESILHNVIIVFLKDEGKTVSRLGGGRSAEKTQKCGGHEETGVDEVLLIDPKDLKLCQYVLKTTEPMWTFCQSSRRQTERGPSHTDHHCSGQNPH